MKTLFIAALMSVISIAAFSQTSGDGKLRLGVGAAYASEVDGSGVSAKAIYEITEKWEAAVTFSHFFENLGLTWNVLDIDGHFVFYDNDKKTNIYGLTGLALTYWERKTVGTILFPSETRSGTYTGLNIGVGANFALSERINLAPELRATVLDESYTRVGLTVQYMF